MAKTYEPIATHTLGSAAADYTFSSIAGTYTDLIVILNASQTTAGFSTLMRFNSDTGSNYSGTAIAGSGSAATSSRTTSSTSIYLGYQGTTTIFTTIVQIQNYSNSTTNKTCLTRKNQSDSFVEAMAGLWRNTAAITSITLLPESGNFATGSTFTLYGIKAA